MTSSTHDDRIEVLSVAGVAAGSSTGAIGGSERRSSSGFGAQGLALVAPLPGGVHPGKPPEGSSVDRPRPSIGGGAGTGERGQKGGSGGGRRGSTATGGSGRRSSTRQSSIHSHRPSTHDARRGRGYTYLVPSPDDPYRTVDQIPPKEIKTDSQKRVARIVMVLASLMLIMSLLLVGITLSMSDHIDEMATTTEMDNLNTTLMTTVRKMNGLSTTAQPPLNTQPPPTRRQNDSSSTTPIPQQ